MAMNMTIQDVPTADLAAIVAGLVAQGLTFEASPISQGLWLIRLTGGY